MKKMTEKDFVELEKNNVKLEADNGRLVTFFNDNEEVTSWFDKNTFKFATSTDYEKFNLEAISDAYALEMTKKKYAGKSALEKIVEAEKSYSEHDKAMIAHFNNRLYY